MESYVQKRYFVPKIWELCKVTFCQKVLYIQKNIPNHYPEQKIQISRPEQYKFFAQDSKVEYFFERHRTFWQKVIFKTVRREKIVLVIEKFFWNLRLKAENLHFFLHH